MVSGLKNQSAASWAALGRALPACQGRSPFPNVPNLSQSCISETLCLLIFFYLILFYSMVLCHCVMKTNAISIATCALQTAI